MALPDRTTHPSTTHPSTTCAMTAVICSRIWRVVQRCDEWFAVGGGGAEGEGDENPFGVKGDVGASVCRGGGCER